MVFALIPLLFEAELISSVNKIWLCLAPRELRLIRAMKRDKSTKEMVVARMSVQIPDEEKIEK